MSMINISLFSQVLKLIDRGILKDIVRSHDSDKHNKGITSWTHLVAMLFMHLANANVTFPKTRTVNKFVNLTEL